MENLGPDHILYPALTDQPLVNIYLKTSYGFRIEDNGETSDRNTIASFPNKFVCLIPFHYSEVICNEIASHIQKEWSKIVTDGFKYLCSILDLPENGSDAHQLSDLFKRQADSYWNFDWAAVKLINGEDVGKLNELLPEQDFKKNLCFYNTFKKVAEKKTYSSSQDFSISYFYNVTHTLVQKALGASKSIKYNSRKPEPGEKCSICGEFEILHSIPWKDGTSASVYSNNVKEFWEQVGKKWSNELDFSQDERKEHLCSVCFLKRGLYKILEKKRNHILSEVFKEQEGFPSTTEIALAHYFERHQIPNGRERKRIAQEIHKNEEIKKSDLTIRDRYFALLLMDGDHMGKLVSGESINASWRSVLQLELSKKLVENPSIDEDYRNAWKKSIDQTRLLTPAIHEAISESLGDFALYCVAPIIEKYGGKLVYAGGDDVCAFLPVHTALEAALKIRETYHHAFRLIDKNGNLKVPLGNWQIEEGKLSIGLGKGKDISISASLLFFHHKENLKWCMHEAHLVLDKIAKEQNGRNSLAVGLYKRSGGEPKLYVRKWEEGTSLNSGLENSVWSCLQNVATAIANSGKPKELSRSLVYNLAKNRPALLSLAKLKNKEEALNCLQLYILSQLDRSSIKSAQPNELAKDIANIIWDPSKEWENSISTNGLIIASFLANQ